MVRVAVGHQTDNHTVYPFHVSTVQRLLAASESVSGPLGVLPPNDSRCQKPQRDSEAQRAQKKVLYRLHRLTQVTHAPAAGTPGT